MKARLLRKCRNQIRIINNYGTSPTPFDKRIMVVKMVNLRYKPLLNSKGGKYYAKLGNAMIKRREEILSLARELSTKSCWYNVFH